MKYLIGMGNYFMYDDGIGLKIIEYISKNKLDMDFQAIELSGNVLNLISYFNPRTEKILLIDSAKMDLPPGDFCFFKPDQAVTLKTLDNISTHEGDVLKVLQLAKDLNYHLPDFEIMGIQPEVIKSEDGLSPALKNRFIDYVHHAIARLNVGIRN
jgi:hydrogenase maturation protease